MSKLLFLISTVCRNNFRWRQSRDVKCAAFFCNQIQNKNAEHQSERAKRESNFACIVYIKKKLSTKYRYTHNSTLVTGYKSPIRQFHTDHSKKQDSRETENPVKQDSQSEGSSGGHRSFKLARISSVVAGISILLLVKFYYDEKRKQRQEDKAVKDAYEPYHDRDFGKNSNMIKYKGFLLPSFTAGSLEDIKDFKVNDGDIFVVSFPKSGTTWVQQMVTLISSRVDVEKSRQVNVEERFPYLEYIYPGTKHIQNMKGPRMIKTHLPYQLLPDDVKNGKGKVIYVARNPMDVSVSYYHFVRMVSEISYKGTFKEFFDKFINDEVAYGSWWRHVSQFWHLREKNNLLFITYEDLHQTPVQSAKVVSEFLGVSLTNEELVSVAYHSHFSRMKDNPATNYAWWDNLGIRNKHEATFLRKGKVGDWKNYYTDSMQQDIADKNDKHLPSGLKFVYEIKKKTS